MKEGNVVQNGKVVYFPLLRMIPSYLVWNHFIASSLLSRCLHPRRPGLRFLCPTFMPFEKMKKKIITTFSRFFCQVFYFPTHLLKSRVNILFKLKMGKNRTISIELKGNTLDRVPNKCAKYNGSKIQT